MKFYKGVNVKYLVQVLAVITFMLISSGCSTSAQSRLDGLNGNGCNNPHCQCPKPCQCGSTCRCGMNGNAQDMNGSK